MAQNKTYRLGPIALTSSYTTNLCNPPAATGGVNAGSSGQYIILKKLRIINKTGTQATFRLFLGATGANAAGTEIFYDLPVAGNSYFETVDQLVLTTSDFLVGGASANTTLVLLGEGEIGVS